MGYCDKVSFKYLPFVSLNNLLNLSRDEEKLKNVKFIEKKMYLYTSRFI